MPPAMTTSHDILALIRAEAARIGIAPSTLCQRAVRNAGLVRRLESGKSVTVDVAARLKSWAAQQPSGSGNGRKSSQGDEVAA